MSTDPETGDGPLSGPRLKQLGWFVGAFVVVGAALMAWPTINPGLHVFYDRTIASQINRESPFSVWGQAPSLAWGQQVVQGLTAALALLVAFIPKRRTLSQIAALAAAVIIMAQLTADHWFYLYIVWFFPILMVAMTAIRTSVKASQASAERTAPTAVPTGS